MHKTVLVKLEIADADKARLQATFSDYKQAWQSVSDYVFTNDCRNRQKVHHATYRDVRKGLPSLPSALVQEARNDAIGKAKSVKSNGRITAVAPRLKRVSIRFDKRTASLKDDVLSFSANGGKRIKAKIVSFPMLDGLRGFKTFAPVIFNRRGQYWAALTFDVPPSETPTGGIVGVDVGLRILVATSDGRLIRGTKMNRLRRKTRFLKSALRSKGTKSARRRFKHVGTLEKRQSRDVTHCAVNEVLRCDASTIAVERLSLKTRKYRVSSNRRRLSVPMAEFLRILGYKAELSGRRMIYVNPAYTSQDDCRGLERGIRTGGRYVGLDGFTMQADINAACNIAWRAQALTNNPVSALYKRIDGQGRVNGPIACKSSASAAVLQAAVL
jgi:IS605 OrfB family transposase